MKTAAIPVAPEEQAGARDGLALLIERPLLSDPAAEPRCEKTGEDITDCRAGGAADESRDRLDNTGPHQSTDDHQHCGSWK
jgi:hypothetical protein